MATIHDNFDTLNNGPGGPGTFPIQEIEPNVFNYWGNTPEKQFVLPFWKADQLIGDSPSNELALKLTNVDDPALVDGTWVSYNADDPDGENTDNATGGLIGFLINLLESLQPSTPEPPATYYVIGESLYDPTGTENFRQFTPHTRMAILGRIGKTTTDRLVVYFAVCELVRQDGTGGPGAATGAKVPSDDDE